MDERMQNNELIKKAYEYFKESAICGLYGVYDIGDCIVAFGGNPNKKIYGCRSIEVNKISREMKLFASWMDENIKLLNDAKVLDIPEEYIYQEGV